MLRGWLAGDNKCVMNPQQAAQELFKAAKGAGTDETEFIRIMCNLNPEVYRQTAQTYFAMHKVTLRDTIKKEFTGKSEYAFLLAHDYLMNPAETIADLLKESTAGAGTKDELLVELTVLFADYFKG